MHYFLLTTTKAKFVHGSEKAMAKQQIAFNLGLRFFFKNSIGLYGKLSSCLAIGKEAVTSTDTKSVRHFYFEWIPGAILYNSNSQVNKCVEKPSTTQLSVNFFHLCTRFTGGKEPDETKIRIWYVVIYDGNKYTVDLSVVYSYGLSYFGLRFLLKEITFNSY